MQGLGEKAAGEYLLLEPLTAESAGFVPHQCFDKSFFPNRKLLQCSETGVVSSVCLLLQ